jgi:hypothetical protein
VNLITAWDGSEPLAYSFSDALVGTSAWAAWDGQRNVGAEKTATHDVHHDLTQSEAGKQFAMHFLSLRHMMERRQSELDATLPPNVLISKSSGKPREKAIESEVPRQAGPAAVVPQQPLVVQPTATETVTETELEPVQKDEGEELVPIGQ